MEAVEKIQPGKLSVGRFQLQVEVAQGDAR